MCLSKSLQTLAGCLILLCSICASDVTVQVNVNRPLNDVSEKFVSFAMHPEDLFRALDGPNRKSVTHMAAMLGDAYVKFVGDFYFASSPDTTLPDPSKIIWKGFNQWTRAVNWTMIIPVPYSPRSWNPMEALKILNSSYNIGITDCIWQLGTDFSSSRAQDYVNELNTFNLMVDSFRPSVEEWKVVGADISAGSSAGETRRYVEMSRDVNAAFGWTQPALLTPSNRMSTYIYDSDLALRILLGQNVPVWLSLPAQATKFKRQHSSSNHLRDDEANHAFRWATTLGEAASLGFDAVFKPISAAELEQPSFSFYVTALFKKVMGSRVFPPKPLHVFAKTSKLYTHCANDISGGIAFMVVNSDERAVEISVRSTGKFRGTEVWQYSLQQKQGVMWLNDEILTLNSSLAHQMGIQKPDDGVQLVAPGMSVSFWIFPNVELEHCQFTAVQADGGSEDSKEKVLEKRYSSSDRLLKQLIQETSFANSAVLNRANRYANLANRARRFILEGPKAVAKHYLDGGLIKLFQPAPALEEQRLQKRSNETVRTLRQVALNWLRQFVPASLSPEPPLLKRDARHADKSYFGPLFGNKAGKRKVITRKITEIKKPERKSKPIYDPEEFDEEEYFRKIGEPQEPEHPRFPEGDVHLSHIARPEGDDDGDDDDDDDDDPDEDDDRADDGDEERKIERDGPLGTTKSLYKFSERKPLRLLGGALQFPEPNSDSGGEKAEEEHNFDSTSVMEAEPVHPGPFNEDSEQQTEEFFRKQRELSHAFLNDEAIQSGKSLEQHRRTANTEGDLKEVHLSQFLDDKFLDYYVGNFDNYFDEHELATERGNTPPLQVETLRGEHEEPRLDLSAPRKKRALNFPNPPEEDWRRNTITKVELNPLAPAGPIDVSVIEYEAGKVTSEGSAAGTSIPDASASASSITGKSSDAESTIPDVLVAKVKEKVSKFVDMVGHQFSQLYNVFTKYINTSRNVTEKLI